MGFIEVNALLFLFPLLLFPYFIFSYLSLLFVSRFHSLLLFVYEMLASFSTTAMWVAHTPLPDPSLRPRVLNCGMLTPVLAR